MRQWVWLLAVVVVASGCFAPQPSAGAPCGPGDRCPTGLSCIEGRCVTGGGGTSDGGADSEVDSGGLPTECTGMPDGTACGDTASSECNAPDTCLGEVCTSNEAMNGAACYDCMAGPTQCATCAQGTCPDGACEPNGAPTATQLISPRVGGNGDEGNMFDVVAGETITITSFETHTNRADMTEYEIWTKPGTYVGFHNEPSAWTRIGTSTFMTAGQDAFTQIPIPINITMTAGQRRAFYLTHKQLNNRYHNGTQVGAPLVSTPQLTLYEGAGVDYGSNGFSGINTPRAWEGVIRYRRGGGQTLATPMAGTVASDGVMFTVTPARDLEVSLLGVHLASGTHDVAVYFRRGTFSGAETTEAEWKPLATANNVVSAGASTTTFLPVMLDLFLESGTTTAFYVATTSGALRSQPMGGGNSAASNDDVVIGHGVTISGSFGTVGSQVTPNVELGYGACM